MGLLIILNGIKDPVNIGVMVGMNKCADIPLEGTSYGDVPAGAATNIAYSKTGGHNCDGNQGTFTVAFVHPRLGTAQITFNFNTADGMGRPVFQSFNQWNTDNTMEMQLLGGEDGFTSGITEVQLTIYEKLNPNGIPDTFPASL